MRPKESPAQRLDALLDRLKKRGHRLTPQRVAIIRALVRHTGHPTVDELHRLILAEFPTTSLATVYKTISLLKDNAEVLELGFGELGSRYDGRRPEPHPHLICTGCGGISDTDTDSDSALAALVDSLASQADFAVSAHRFDLFGLCPACRKDS